MKIHYDDEISKGEVKIVILLGAPRSGTQMFRDMICTHENISTWPYNEMTYMWRYKNRNSPTEELVPSQANSVNVRYIRKKFIDLAKKTNSKVVLDKTCHNCLRVPFVEKVLPEAKYIYLIRNGLDVIPSMHKRWIEPPPKGEYRRIFSIPLQDLFYYITKVGWNHLGLVRPGNKQVRVWGPRYAGLEELVSKMSLQDVCAHQWLTYANKCEEVIYSNNFQPELLTVKYDEVTSNPSEILDEVFRYLDTQPNNEINERWEKLVRHHEPGAKGNLLGKHKESVLKIISNKLQEHGYHAESEEKF